MYYFTCISFAIRPSGRKSAIKLIDWLMCVIINGHVGPDLWPFDLETGMQVASKLGNFPFKFGHARPLGSRIIRYVRDERTDRRTDGQKQRLLLLSRLRGHNDFTEHCVTDCCSGYVGSWWRRNCRCCDVRRTPDGDKSQPIRSALPRLFHARRSRSVQHWSWICRHGSYRYDHFLAFLFSHRQILVTKSMFNGCISIVRLRFRPTVSLYFCVCMCVLLCSWLYFYMWFSSCYVWLPFGIINDADDYSFKVYLEGKIYLRLVTVNYFTCDVL